MLELKRLAVSPNCALSESSQQSRPIQNGYSTDITCIVPVSIEAPEGWGPTQRLIAELQRFGYRVEEWRVLGRPVLVIT